MNKKGQREVAGIWIFVLIFYYICLGLILTATANIESTNSFINGSSGGYINSGLSGMCDKPRETYNANGDLTKTNDRTTSCALTLGTFDEEVCNRIIGCTYDNITTGIFWWKDTLEICTGTINRTYYSGDDSTAFKSICKWSNVLHNETACEDLGCKWNEDIPEIDSYSVWDLVKDIFTNDVSFGFENDGVNNLLTFIFVWFPLIVIAFAFYISVR